MDRKYRFEWLLLATAVLILGTLFATFLVRETRLINAREQERLELQAEIIQDKLVNYLVSIDRALSSIIAVVVDPGSRAEAPERVEMLFSALVESKPVVRNMFVTDAQGLVRIASHPELVGVSIHDHPSFRMPRQRLDHTLLFVHSAAIPVGDTWTMHIARIIPGQDGEFAGVVALTLERDYILSLLDTARSASDMHVSLVHGDSGGVISTWEHNAQGPPHQALVHATPARMPDILRASRTVQPESLNMDNPLHVVVSRGRDAVHAQRQSQHRALTGLFVLLVLLPIPALYFNQQRRMAVEERAQATERKLHEKNVELERFFTLSLDMLCIADIDGRFTRVNPEWEAVLGFPLAEIEGRYYLDFVHPEDVQRTRAAGDRLWAGEDMLFFENRLRCADGDYRWIEWRSKPHGDKIYAAARDVTDRKRAEDALIRAEMRYRSIFERAVTGIAFADDQGNILTFNESFQNLIGYDPDELFGMHFSHFTHPDDISREFQLYEQVAVGDREDYRLEKRYITKSGEVLWVDLSVTVLRNEQGRMSNFVGLVVDITERKQVERELVHAKEAAESASRAKSDFLAIMSHEIRTPLNAVIGLTQLCLEYDLESRLRDYLQKVLRSSGMLLDILNDILDYSRIESGRLVLEQRVFPLAAVIDQLATLLEAPVREKGLALALHVDPDVPQSIEGDSLRLGQALGNLLGNAVKFTAQGKVELRVSVQHHDAQWVQLRFSVNDTGIGISPEIRDRLFTMFTQADTSTSRKFGGTGLGLAISKRLAEMMNGTLDFESVPGQGSTFIFTATFRIAPQPLPSQWQMQANESVRTPLQGHSPEAGAHPARELALPRQDPGSPQEDPSSSRKSDHGRFPATVFRVDMHAIQDVLDEMIILVDGGDLVGGEDLERLEQAFGGRDQEFVAHIREKLDGFDYEATSVLLKAKRAAMFSASEQGA